MEGETAVGLMDRGAWKTKEMRGETEKEVIKDDNNGCRVTVAG